MKKNTKFVVKLVVGTAVIGVATTGFIMKHEGYDFKKIDFTDLFPKKQEEVIETDNYTKHTVSNSDYDYGYDEYSQTLETYDLNEEENATNFKTVEIPDEIAEKDDSPLPDEFSAITEKVNTNIFEISDFINGSDLPDSPYYVDFVDWIDNDNDRYVVGFFAALFNGIKEQAYLCNDRESTIEGIVTFLINYDGFTNGKSLQFSDNGNIVELTYDDISPRAKVIIIPMAQALTMIDYDFKLGDNLTTIDILNETCDQYDIAMQALEARRKK